MTTNSNDSSDNDLRPDGGKVIMLLRERLRDGLAGNWCTAWDNSIWHIPGDENGAYINGVMLTIDFDFEGAYLLEINSDAGFWHALAIFLSRSDPIIEWMPAPPQKFFERSVNAWEAIRWAVDTYKRIDEEVNAR